MPVILETGDKIQGVVASGGQVDYSIFGISGTDLYRLASGQLPDTLGDLYTASTAGAIVSIVLVNRGDQDTAVNLYLKPPDGDARGLVPRNLVLKSGYCAYLAGNSLTIATDEGKVLRNMFVPAHRGAHEDGGSDEINLEGLDGEPLALTTHKDATTGVHGAGSNYIAQAPASGHLVRSFTKGWTAGKRLKGNGVNSDPTEYDDIISITYIIDGGGSAITTGSKGYLEIPFDCTITGWTLLADQTGSIVIDVKKCTYNNFPTTSSIAGSEKPTLSSARKNQDLSLSTWTTSVSAGDILEFVVESASTVTRVTLGIRAIKN